MAAQLFVKSEEEKRKNKEQELAKKKEKEEELNRKEKQEKVPEKISGIEAEQAQLAVEEKKHHECLKTTESLLEEADQTA